MHVRQTTLQRVQRYHRSSPYKLPDWCLQEPEPVDVNFSGWMKRSYLLAGLKLSVLANRVQQELQFFAPDELYCLILHSFHKGLSQMFRISLRYSLMFLRC